MKRWLIVMAILVLLVALAAVVLPFLARAKTRGGSDVQGNLRYLQLTKDYWLADRNTNEWPTTEDLLGPASSGKSFNERMRRRYGELYFINHTGAPPFAYFPKAGGQYSAGDIVVLTTNGLVKFRQ